MNFEVLIDYLMFFWLFYDESPYHIETNLLICSVNQWTGFYMIGTSVTKELKNEKSETVCGTFGGYFN